MSQLFEAPPEQGIYLIVMSFPFQLVQQRKIPEILLKVKGTSLVDRIDSGYGTALFAEMPAEINKGAIFDHVFIVSGYTGIGICMDPEIHAVAPGLRDLVYPRDLPVAARVFGVELFYLLQDLLHGLMMGLKPAKVCTIFFRRTFPEHIK